MPNITLSEIVSCLSGYDPDAIPVEQAKTIIRDFITSIEDTEKMKLHDALGRVLAEDMISPINVPAHDNAAMDGYALRGVDLKKNAPTTLTIIGTALAGKPYSGMTSTDECVHIMTGAVMPAGCDTVLPQEFVQDATQTSITFPEGVVKKNGNRRLKGEDLEAGAAALKKGTILHPAELGLLASLGIAEVAVRRRLRVAIFSTGDELRSSGEALDEGSIYDSNRHTLYGMLTRLGCEVVDIGIVQDKPALLEIAFRKACENADVMITSGGVSVGTADYTKQVMSSLGDMTFWKIGMRPGRPMAFGKIHSNGKSAILFGLPGNPVAVMVTFYFLVRDALLNMMGATPSPLPLIPVKTVSSIQKKMGRTEYQRGILSRNDEGELQVRLTGSQGSGILRSMSEANCMIVLSQERKNIETGDMVNVILFDGLV
jgi:molybdopterin molybdotransferase